MLIEIPAAAAMVLALQNVAARETDPLESVVVTIGTIAGGYRNNVIADAVEMSGTLRAFDATLRGASQHKLERIVRGIARAYGVEAELRIVEGYPPVVNDERLAADATRYLKEHTSVRVVTARPTMGGEDFAYFAERVPGLQIRLGVRSWEAGAMHPAHSAEFRIDEDALAVGVETLVAFAIGVTTGAIGG